MNQTIQKSKRVVREFIRTQYTDRHLVQALDHLRSGEMAYCSCCCLIGLTTANHADGKLRGQMGLEQIAFSGAHLFEARKLTGAAQAEAAYCRISGRPSLQRDADRTKILIPMILFEIRRRNHVRMEERRLVKSETSPILQETSTVGC